MFTQWGGHWVDTSVLPNTLTLNCGTACVFLLLCRLAHSAKAKINRQLTRPAGPERLVGVCSWSLPLPESRLSAPLPLC